MIKYHGTPIGGPNTDVARFLTNRHALVSFAYPQHMAIVADVCSSFILDNGAFTAWKKGGQIDYHKYIEFVEFWHKHPGFDWALIPDVIDGDEEENDFMIEEWPMHLNGVPVWHMHESIERLQRLTDLFSVVAIGSSGSYPDPGLGLWPSRMEEVMDVICDELGRPPCRLHGLRMLDPRIFSKYPFASADSTNCGQNNNRLERYGMYVSPDAWVRTTQIATRIEKYNSSPVWVSKNQLNLF